MAPGAAAGGTTPEAEAAPVEEKTEFDVKLTGFDAAAKIKVIKEVRAMTNLGLKEAKELVRLSLHTTAYSNFKLIITKCHRLLSMANVCMFYSGGSLQKPIRYAFVVADIGPEENSMHVQERSQKLSVHVCSGG